MTEREVLMALGSASVDFPELEDLLQKLARDPDFAKVFALALTRFEKDNA